MKVRIKFRKYGPIRYIGHLDVMRYFQKAMRRAEIDIAYTTGFSPHQIMSFASPLGVGLESNGEYMDIECNSVTTSQDMIERLNNVSAPGIDVTSIKLLPENAGNAMASVAAARYTVRFKEGKDCGILKYDLTAKLAEFLSKENIFVNKETKNGIKEIDIRSGIYEMKALDHDTFTLFVDASSSGNIKPVIVMNAFLSMMGETLCENALQVTREDVYTNIGTDEMPDFVTLDSVGDDIL